MTKIVVIVATWNAPQCALVAREEEREGALQRTLAPARDPGESESEKVILEKVKVRK